MKEHEDILDFYSSEYYYIYAQAEPDTWANRDAAKTYLRRYAVSHEEYQSRWKVIQEGIFALDEHAFPNPIFQKTFHLYAFLGGLLLTEDDLPKLQQFMKLGTDDYFLVVSNNVDDDAAPPLRFRFPLTTTWQELTGGAFISTVLFEMPHNDYFVFGSSGKWGKYVANDLETPLDIFGVSEDLCDNFVGTYVDPGTSNKDIRSAIPAILEREYRFHWF